MDCDHREIDDGRGLIKRYLHGDNNKISLGNGKISTGDDAQMIEINGEKDRTAEALRKDGEEGLSIEELFDSKKVPPWWEQLTLRGILVSFLVGTMFSIIMMKLNLTTGLATTMNISAGLLGFVFMRSWSEVLDKAGLLNTPFTRQENTVIQTCVVACYSTAYGGGFGSYLLAMNKKTYEQAGIDSEGNTPNTIKQPSIGWMVGFLFLVTFAGLLVLVPLRKVLITNKRLTYPSGTATAVLINGFHTPQGNKLAKYNL